MSLRALWVATQPRSLRARRLRQTMQLGRCSASRRSYSSASSFVSESRHGDGCSVWVRQGTHREPPMGVDHAGSHAQGGRVGRGHLALSRTPDTAARGTDHRHTAANEQYSLSRSGDFKKRTQRGTASRRDRNEGFYLPFRRADPLDGMDRGYNQCGEPVCKPGSVRAPRAGCVATIHLRHASPRASSGLPADSGGPPSGICAGRTVSGPSRPCSGWGLPSRPRHRGRWCALTAPFHPYRHGPGPGRRSVLCGTVPRVTPGWRYQPPCPVEPGLSSNRPVTRSTRGRPTDSPRRPV